MPAMCPFPLAALVTLITLPSDHALHLGTCTCRRSSKEVFLPTVAGSSYQGAPSSW